MNLRGVRESGTFFALPTYAFMVAILGHVRLRAASGCVSGDPARRARAPDLDITPGARATSNR